MGCGGGGVSRMERQRGLPRLYAPCESRSTVFLGDDTLVGIVGRAIGSHVHVADMRICKIKELIICLPAGRVESVTMSLRDAVSMSNGAARSSPVSKAYRQEAKMIHAKEQLHLSVSTNGSIQGLSNVCTWRI